MPTADLRALVDPGGRFPVACQCALLGLPRSSYYYRPATESPENLGLMRMNSPRDLAELADVFGFAPEELLRQSASFRQGQALFAGGFVTEPTLVQMGARVTEEGGSDVRVPIA